jgi:hypothetical protein
MPKLSDVIYKKVIADYLGGKTQKEVGEINSIGRDAVGKILKRLGVEIREYTGERLSNQRWIWDFDFFTKKNPITAYWAGFLIADGNINDSGNVMAVVIQKGDAEFFYNFCNDISLPKDACFSDRNIIGIHLNNRNLGKQLEPWGIIPRKSKNFHAPNIDIGLLPHFLRGWIDGDGSVYRYGRASRISVASGNLPSMEWFAQSLWACGYTGNIGIHKTSSKIYPDNYYLYIGGTNQVAEVCSVLGVDEFFCMERKWNKTYEGNRTKIQRICKCGNAFLVDQHRVKTEPTHGRFCSKKCWHDYQRGE